MILNKLKFNLSSLNVQFTSIQKDAFGEKTLISINKNALPLQNIDDFWEIRSNIKKNPNFYKITIKGFNKYRIKKTLSLLNFKRIKILKCDDPKIIETIAKRNIVDLCIRVFDFCLNPIDFSIFKERYTSKKILLLCKTDTCFKFPRKSKDEIILTHLLRQLYDDLLKFPNLKLGFKRECDVIFDDSCEKFSFKSSKLINILNQFQINDRIKKEMLILWHKENHPLSRGNFEFGIFKNIVKMATRIDF